MKWWPRQRWRRRVLTAALVVIVPFAGHFLWFLLEGLTDERVPSDVAVVLGNAVEENGEPSPRLAGRLDAALALYREGVVPYVIVSGGLGLEGFDEAVVMRDYLVKHGVPADRVVADSFGINTAATARNSARIMEERGWRTATAVSQHFHIARCKLAFRQAGIKTVYGVHARYFEGRDYPSSLRDYVGYWAYLIRNSGRRGDSK
jgi:vancomycin permeability regulator SanA